jgi:hypothetical protein
LRSPHPLILAKQSILRSETLHERIMSNTNLWESKPWWCQPWTIILTGVIIIAGSWLVFHTLWLTVPVAILIVLWWTYFLIVVPRMLATQNLDRS